MSVRQYEAMFLFDSTFAAQTEDAEAEITRLLNRAEAEVLVMKRWDERRLAYRVKGHKRGVYYLCYFKCAPSKITALERDAQISESVLRSLILTADEVDTDLMDKFYEARGESLTGPLPGEERDGDDYSEDRNGRRGGRRDRDRDRDGDGRRGDRPYRDRAESAPAPAPSPSSEGIQS